VHDHKTGSVSGSKAGIFMGHYSRMAIDLEVKSSRELVTASEAQSVGPQGRREGNVGRSFDRRTGTGHEAVPSEPTSAKAFVSTLCALRSAVRMP
jgi:hypothetical protein